MAYIVEKDIKVLYNFEIFELLNNFLLAIY